MCTTAGSFFGRFSALKTKWSWQNLEFLRKFLEFFWKYLDFIQKNGKFFQNSLNFPNFKLRLVEKLMFGQFFVQNIPTSGLFWAKKSVLTWQIIEFVNDLLEFFENLLEFFLAWLFLALSFFRNVQKKACITLIRHYLPRTDLSPVNEIMESVMSSFATPS